MRRARVPVDVPKLLERLGIRAKKTARTKWTATCPNPGHKDRTPSWFIRDDELSDYHATHCCKSCGFSGGAAKLAGAVLGLDEEAARAWVDDLREPRPLPMRIMAEVTERVVHARFRLPAVCEPLDAEGRDYLRSRGIEAGEVVAYSVSERARAGGGKRHPLAHRVLFPFFDRAGQPVSYTARALFETRKRYAMPSKEENADPDALYGEHEWEGRRDVVVCEGVIDALAARRAFMGLPAVAALAGSAPSPGQVLKLGRFRRVVVATDNDAAGEKAWEAIREGLAAFDGLELRRVRPPPGQDFGKLGENAAGEEEIRALLGPHLRGMVLGK